MSTSTKQTGLRLDDQLCFALYAATNSVVRAYRPLLGEVGLTYPQYLVMLALWQDGVTAVHDLAARLQLTSSAITPLVDRLEAAGFVIRTRAADRRIVLVALTEAGRLLEDQVATAQQAVVCRTGLGDRELADLRQDLKDLADRVATAGMAQGDEPG
ncbi:MULTISPECIES: MarR family transcriptional regulator [unclassified Methylobacterium]|uniref:MarR family winged helix-turn-helix transcriptional regulator n=1 Tax=unclassified Methylobacterium TaxID=2615210 RepID=UPI0011C1F112|nr:MULTISPECIES: MarR family transcriptional regulator [unclassified Methylobacterium]QEE41267.1 MarR family transcriptional regulator [Methylobacterium sp. WL1]TXN55050.1 MarR family transcriptional regulator [Methylobacterium sp. WL2]